MYPNHATGNIRPKQATTFVNMYLSQLAAKESHKYLQPNHLRNIKRLFNNGKTTRTRFGTIHPTHWIIDRNMEKDRSNKAHL